MLRCPLRHIRARLTHASITQTMPPAKIKTLIGLSEADRLISFLIFRFARHRKAHACFNPLSNVKTNSSSPLSDSDQGELPLYI